MPNKLFICLKEHSGAFLVSFVLTLLVSAPLIVFPTVAGDLYKGINIPPFGTLDEHFYLSRAKEVVEGGSLASPLIRGETYGQDTFFNYSEKFFLAPIKLLGLADKINIVTIYNFYNFVGVFILSLLIYFFMWQLSRDKLLSIISTAFVIGGYNIAYGNFFYKDLNFYGRAMYPYISSLGFFVYLNFLVKSSNSPSVKYNIYSGIVFGLLFYISFYVWTFTLALNAILLLLYLFKKDHSSFRRIMIISIVGVIGGAYNLYNLFLFHSSDIGRQASYFFSVVYSRQPIFSKMGFVVAILFIAFFLLRRKDKNLFMISALILSGWLSLNQQIVTGRIIQYGHYYWYFIVPVGILMGLYMVWFLINNRKHRNLFFIFLILVIFSHMAIGQYRSFFNTLEAKIYEQSYWPIIEVLNKDSGPGVILGPENRLGLLFTIYTDHDLYWNSSVIWSVVEVQHLKDALYVYAYLNKEARNNFSGFINEIMADNESSISPKAIYKNIEGMESGLNQSDYLKNKINDKAFIIPLRKKILDSLSLEYRRINNSKQMNAMLKKYGVNYIVWDKNIYPEWDLSGLDDLREIARSNNIYLYSLSSQ